MPTSLLAITTGAALGAILRWFLGLVLSTSNHCLPYGTLIANWLGAYLIGTAAVIFSHYSNISPEWRLFIITGFLGGLTTFSTFSLEAIQLLQNHRWVLALIHISLHTGGSLFLTILGILSTQSLLK